MVRLRIKSAANMNAPFNTLKNKGLVPSKSRLISLATRATSFIDPFFRNERSETFIFDLNGIHNRYFIKLLQK